MIYRLLLLPVFVAGVALDQFAKNHFLSVLDLGQSIPSGLPFIYWTLHRNTGVAFGLGASYPPLILLLNGIILILLLSVFISFYKKGFNQGLLALTLILAGATGNLIDRIKYGYVVDFVDIQVWPIFNVADSLICTGAFLLSAYLLLGKR